MSRDSLKNWDMKARELHASLCHDFERMRGQKSSVFREIDRHCKSIRDRQSKILTNLENLVYLAMPKDMLQGDEQFLSHWAVKFSEKVQEYLACFSAGVPLDLWRQTIDRRLRKYSGPEALSALTKSKDVNRISAVRKIKNGRILRLRSNLRDVSKEKKKLLGDYARLVVTRANRDASGSMQNLGSFEGLRVGGMESTVYGVSHALDRFFLNASIGSRRTERMAARKQTRGFATLPRISLRRLDRDEKSEREMTEESFRSLELPREFSEMRSDEQPQDKPPSEGPIAFEAAKSDAVSARDLPQERDTKKAAQYRSPADPEAEMSEMIEALTSDRASEKRIGRLTLGSPRNEGAVDQHLVQLSNHAAQLVPNFFAPNSSRAVPRRGSGISTAKIVEKS